MRFSQEEQDRLSAVIAEFKAASMRYSQACKTFTPYRIAADYPLATPDVIVAYHLALKEYKRECKIYQTARDKYVSIIRAQSMKLPEISDSEAGRLEIGLSIKDIKKEEQKYSISARQQAMAYAVVTRRPDESPQDAADRGLREFDEAQRSECGGSWNLGSEEKEDPTLGDFEPLPDKSITDENA
jgi:hypothetical protein